MELCALPVLRIPRNLIAVLQRHISVSILALMILVYIKYYMVHITKLTVICRTGRRCYHSSIVQLATVLDDKLDYLYYSSRRHN